MMYQAVAAHNFGKGTKPPAKGLAEVCLPLRVPISALHRMHQIQPHAATVTGTSITAPSVSTTTTTIIIIIIMDANGSDD